MSLSTSKSLSKFDPNGTDSKAGRMGEVAYKLSIQAYAEKHFPQNTKYEIVEPSVSEETRDHVDFWQDKYVDGNRISRTGVQVKSKTTPKYVVAEIRRGNNAPGWLLASKAEVLAEQKGNKFWLIKMETLKKKVVEEFGEKVLEDIENLQNNFPTTDDTFHAQWGASRAAGFTPCLHLKATTYRGNESVDVLAYIPISAFKQGEYYEIEAVEPSEESNG